jgi:hypothetical protein
MRVEDLHTYLSVFDEGDYSHHEHVERETGYQDFSAINNMTSVNTDEAPDNSKRYSRKWQEQIERHPYSLFPDTNTPKLKPPNNNNNR